MDALSGISTWLSDHEAGISAVVGIAVPAGVVFAGLAFALAFAALLALSRVLHAPSAPWAAVGGGRSPRSPI